MTCACTLFIDSSTFVTEFFPASASHMVATSRSFNPKLAEGALLKFLTLNEFLKLLFNLIRISAISILLAWLAFVKGRSTAETIMLFALRTVEFFISYRIEDKSIIAVRCWTPRNILLFWYCLLEWELQVFFELLLGQKFSDITNAQLFFAVRRTTNKR
jgi:hypothetical protein